MKKTLLCSIILFIAIYNGYGQRYLPEMHGITISGGFTPENGFYVGGGFQQYTKKKNRWVANAEYLQKTYENIPFQQITADGGYYLQFLRNHNKSLFISIGATAMLGYEIINKGENLLADGSFVLNSNKWIYGGTLALEAEYYLDDKYVLLLTAKERILGGSSLSNFQSQIGIGLKIMLN